MTDDHFPSDEIPDFRKFGFSKKATKMLKENWKKKPPQTLEEIHYGRKIEEENRFDSAIKGLNLKPESKE